MDQIYRWLILILSLLIILFLKIWVTKLFPLGKSFILWLILIIKCKICPNMIITTYMHVIPLNGRCRLHFPASAMLQTKMCWLSFVSTHQVENTATLGDSTYTISVNPYLFIWILGYFWLLYTKFKKILWFQWI